MAKRPSKSEPTKVSPVAETIRRTIDSVDDIAVEELELFTLEIQREPIIDSEDDVDHVILFEIKRGSTQKNRTTYFVDVIVGKTKGTERGGCVAAAYFFSLVAPEENVVFGDEALKRIGKLTVWPAYCQMFNMAISNTSLSFPPLPNYPPHILISDLFDEENPA